MKEKYRKLSFQQHGDERGFLVALEENADIPFKIRRIFYIYGSEKDIIRGKHANRESEFVMICIKGNAKVKVKTGTEEIEFFLNSPAEGIYLDKMTWKEMYDFSEDAVMLVLSNKPYDAEEYIRNYDEFLEVVRKDVKTLNYNSCLF